MKPVLEMHNKKQKHNPSKQRDGCWVKMNIKMKQKLYL